MNGSDMGDAVVDGAAAIEDPPVAGHSSISPVSIKPHSKAGPRKETNTKKAEVWTDTPEKIWWSAKNMKAKSTQSVNTEEKGPACQKQK